MIGEGKTDSYMDNMVDEDNGVGDKADKMDAHVHAVAKHVERNNNYCGNNDQVMEPNSLP